MSTERKRASLFEEADADDIDLSGFAQTTLPPRPTDEQIHAVSEAVNFPSREASAPRPQAKEKPSPRRFRTGRNIQFNAKASRETIDRFYAICDRNEWVMGYTLERAVEALERELRTSPTDASSGSDVPPRRRPMRN